jgi:hypothetical protein
LRWIKEEMIVMNYCGIEFTAVEAADGSSWKWQLSVLDKDRDMTTKGEAASRAAAISQAHEAIGEGLRANGSPDQEARLPHLACGVLDILHGARGLPSAEAIAALQPFMDAMGGRVTGRDPCGDASAAAVLALVQRLDAEGGAGNDLWEEAIEATLSFANEAGFEPRA